MPGDRSLQPWRKHSTVVASNTSELVLLLFGQVVMQPDGQRLLRFLCYGRWQGAISCNESFDFIVLRAPVPKL